MNVTTKVVPKSGVELMIFRCISETRHFLTFFPRIDVGKSLSNVGIDIMAAQERFDLCEHLVLTNGSLTKLMRAFSET